MTEAEAALTPDERIAQGLCPECAMDVSNQAPATHALTHWPTAIFPDGRNQEAIRRQGLLVNYKPTSSTPARHETEHPQSPPHAAEPSARR